MNTYIAKTYLNLIDKLANDFADTRAKTFPQKSYARVFNSTYSVYYNISVYLYIRLNKLSANKTDFSFNRISSLRLRKFSCKLYKSVLDNLIDNQIIVRNNHYFNSPSGFSKSFLIHKNLIRKINEEKQKFQYKFNKIDVPSKVISIGKLISISENKTTITKLCLNRYYRTNSPIDELIHHTHYNELTYQENQLNSFCKDDEILYNSMKKKLNRLKNLPVFTKGRFYHVFHNLSKQFREKVLQLDGENIKEIFDISGSDLHMLAKHLENEDIPTNELAKFQNAVKDDFRKLFGIRKRDGKCKKFVKTAFKVYLNSKKSAYSTFRYNSIYHKIDDYFETFFPHIREYIINHDTIWQTAMNEEFEIMSNRLVNKLKKDGIKALTCHDSIYVKISDSNKLKNIEDLFYDELDFITDRMNKLYDL